MRINSNLGSQNNLIFLQLYSFCLKFDILIILPFFKSKYYDFSLILLCRSPHNLIQRSRAIFPRMLQWIQADSSRWMSWARPDVSETLMVLQHLGSERWEVGRDIYMIVCVSGFLHSCRAASVLQRLARAGTHVWRRSVTQSSLCVTIRRS